MAHRAYGQCNIDVFVLCLQMGPTVCDPLDHYVQGCALGTRGAAVPGREGPEDVPQTRPAGDPTFEQVLEGIISYFKEQDLRQKEEQKDGETMDVEVQSIPQDQLRHVEGTAILHIVFAVRLDQELGREFLKSVKGCQGELCPFSIALLLSVARIQRYEEQLFDFLKGTITKGFKDEHLQQGSKFLQDLLPQRCSLAQMILDTVKNSVFGWDHVTQGLVQLGFILMDAFGPKAGPFGKTATEGANATAKTPTQQACRLGGHILLEGFKVR
ncbi:unnamed protein product [Oncorhynchus mykiss]|uniref:Uncharacterized protein n=1 Tax=Oncorhynchus mykiss TaxID=8022 RepID=A0A060ZBM2_ONCMY|nr:unnamed protein product [Oncorhynchus mykiss]